MKKILFAAYSLDIGGIEKALVVLLNYLAKEKINEQYKYDIILVLEKKQGEYLKDIDQRIKVIEYRVCENKNVIYRKLVNATIQLMFKLKHHNKFDFSVSYATYSLPASFVARTASENSVLWVHSEYMTVFNKNKEQYINFFNKLNIKSFKKVIFVSEKAKEIFKSVYGELENQVQTIYNLIDYEEILEKSKEVINMSKDNVFTFLSVGRHTEEDKKISRIILASEKLKEENIDFKVLLVGDGKDSKKYRQLVKEKGLEKEIVFLGKQTNPYPYYQISDCLLLTSEYEGFPLVYNEAMVLGLPIITTNVSDSKKIIENQFGIIVEKNVNDIYQAMKESIKNGICNKKFFDYKENNETIKRKIDDLINGSEE